MDLRNDKRKKSFLPNIFGMKEKKASEGYENSVDGSADFGDIPTCSEPASSFMKTISGLGSNSSLARLNSETRTQEFRVFVATWNVGGKPPHNGLNLNDFLPADDRSDIYVLGFQEIVPLNAGNVLVAEDSEPAIEWLHLIDRALNRPMVMETCDNQETLPSDCINSSPHSSKSVTGLFFQKPSLKAASGSLRTVPTRRLKGCNCPSEATRKFYRESCFRCPQSYAGKGDTSDDEEDEEPSISMMESDKQNVVYSTPNRLRYSLVACKQMVGIFVTVWAKREHVQHIGHMRLSRIGRGILGCLGNKGCISVSMTLHQTSFCFICSHLASGEKEGDELRRNSDVIEILRNTQFSKICKTSNRRIPERIVGHDRVIWLGDLNYRIALSYTETRKLLDDNDWDMLLNKDQLKIEREAGRVFKGWNEGNIYFPPTYKYSSNSNAYAGDSLTSKKKMKKGRRTPAWCDRILWHGDGIVQMSYVRGESKFSDHRPVCAVFTVEVGVLDGRFKSSLSGPNMKVGVEELLPPNK